MDSLGIEMARSEVAYTVEEGVAIAEKLGYPVKSLLGWQAGFETDSHHSIARIKKINTERLKKEIDKYYKEKSSK